jgi:hypothetical protein
MMKKWAVTAFVYLLVVVGAYYAYASFSGKEAVDHAGADDTHNTDTVHEPASDTGHEEEHATTEEETEHEEGHGDGHSEHGATAGNNEVLPLIHEETGKLVITLKDLNNNPVSDLEVSHEKLMHLIVVSSDLSEYRHLHPESVEPGVYQVNHDLEAGEYKIFVDIKPKDLAYQVQPINFLLGNPDHSHGHEELQPDTELVKQVGNHSVALLPSSLEVNQEIQLTFDLNGETPEPYLGALGHVVILDETAENYIHVHPHDGDEPVFETKFTKPGIYKIWAEFKFEGEVFVFPYVVDIK